MGDLLGDFSSYPRSKIVYHSVLDLMSITLYQGDCLQVMKQLPAKSVDLFMCDLPFGCLATGGPNTKKKLCSWDIKIDLEEFWKQVERLAKHDKVPILHFCTTKYGYELIQSNPSWFRYDLVWNKERGVSFLSANKMPMRSHEMVYVFSKSGAYYNRVDIKGEFKAWKSFNHESKVRVYNKVGKENTLFANANDGSTRCALSVITMRKPNTRGHPTEKPKDLYKWLIERYCPPGGTVLDPTAGSGNSGFATYDLDRHAILIEKDKAFHDAIEKKMDTL